MIRGVAKIDGITVGELRVAFLGAQRGVTAKAAFVNLSTGETHGWTENSTWGPEVIAKVAELRAAMEVDLSKLHFDETETDASVGKGLRFERAPSGIAEQANAKPTGDDVPSV